MRGGYRERFVLAVLAGLGSALAAPSAGAQELTGAEILARIAGNTISGDMGGPFEEYYRRDGTLRGATAEGRYDGKWTVADGRFCLEYSEPLGCFAVRLDGETLTFIDEDGEVAGTGTLGPGNPNGF